MLDSLLTLIEGSKAGELKNVEALAREGGALMGVLGELERLREMLEVEVEGGEMGEKGEKKGWRGVRRLGRKLVWPLKEGDVVKALEGLERWRGVVGLAVSVDQA